MTPAQVAELVLAARVLEVALVHLDDDGQGPVVEPVRLQVLQHVVPVGERRGRLAAARVGDEGHRVRALEHDAAGGLVHHLARHRVELQLHLHARLRPEEDGHHVEEEGAVVLRVERHEPPAHLRIDLLEERLEVRRLPGERGAVVDDLDGDLAGLCVELDHGSGGAAAPGAVLYRIPGRRSASAARRGWPLRGPRLGPRRPAIGVHSAAGGGSEPADMDGAGRTAIATRSARPRSRSGSHWLLRLRWLIVPVFVAVDLAGDLLMHRRDAVDRRSSIGAVLLAANALYSVSCSRRRTRPPPPCSAGRASSPLWWSRVPVGGGGPPRRPGEPAALRRPRRRRRRRRWSCRRTGRGGGGRHVGGRRAHHRRTPIDDGLRPRPHRRRRWSARWAMEAGDHRHRRGHRRPPPLDARVRPSARLRAARRAASTAATGGVGGHVRRASHEMVFVTDPERRDRPREPRLREAARAAPARARRAAPLAELLAGHPRALVVARTGDGIEEIEDPLLRHALRGHLRAPRRPRRARRARRGRAARGSTRGSCRRTSSPRWASLASGVAHDDQQPDRVRHLEPHRAEALRRRRTRRRSRSCTELGLQAGGRADADPGRPRPRRTLAFARGARRRAPSRESLAGHGADPPDRREPALARAARSGGRAGRAGRARRDRAGGGAHRRRRSALRRGARGRASGPVWVLGHRGELVDVVAEPRRERGAGARRGAAEPDLASSSLREGGERGRCASPTPAAASRRPT